MTAGNMVSARGQCLLLATFPILASIWFNTGSEETRYLFLSTVNHCSSCQALIVFCLSIVEMDAGGDSFCQPEAATGELVAGWSGAPFTFTQGRRTQPVHSNTFSLFEDLIL